MDTLGNSVSCASLPLARSRSRQGAMLTASRRAFSNLSPLESLRVAALTVYWGSSLSMP
jgi:hypothetical protein